ncbi:hypothetical protein [Veronia pacifica]|uniref:Uncharacterized protein n=1 Tax=Veronia pacifica TaxID=1080227 RepID=A0A1C3EA85_9GAMM|nr:hypothetical protein [Veronia pacifica]ODA30124.1 hypothetical protein A8L45_21015 [Veronia pacifica]
MNLKRILIVICLFLTPALSFAEIITFKAKDINFESNNLYPSLDVSKISDIFIRLDSTEVGEGFGLSVNNNIHKVDFVFPNANKLTARGFQKLASSTNGYEGDAYRTITPSPWVFKKLAVQITSQVFVEGEDFSFKIFVVNGDSYLDNTNQVTGDLLLEGSAKLVNTSPRRVVDVLHTRYLDKRLRLRLYENIVARKIQIQATWHGYGVSILEIDRPFAPVPNMKPIGVRIQDYNGQRVVIVRLSNGVDEVETYPEILSTLLDTGFSSFSPN